jgi:hypothetical protein
LPDNDRVGYTRPDADRCTSGSGIVHDPIGRPGFIFASASSCARVTSVIAFALIGAARHSDILFDLRSHVMSIGSTAHMDLPSDCFSDGFLLEASWSSHHPREDTFDIGFS